MFPKMNVWKPIQNTNELVEGLISIEECTKYDENFLSKTLGINSFKKESNGVAKKSKNITKKKKTKNVKPRNQNNQNKLPLDLTPSKQGYTEDQNIVNSQISCESKANLAAWSHLPLQQPLLQALASLKFEEPTAIQSMTLPAAMLGNRDILGAAETGSGKTLAFGLPILQGILKLKEFSNTSNDSDKTDVERQDDFDESNNLHEAVDFMDFITDSKHIQKPLYALILTPTRELAIQVMEHLKKLAKYTDINIAVVIGGMAVEKQLRLLSKGPEIIVATPGRLWELIEQGNGHLLEINNIKYLVIDETDRMLEKGHFQELEKILERINVENTNNSQRQNFVFSATLTLVHELPKYLQMKKRGKFRSKISNLTPAQKLQMIVETLNITNPKVVDITQGKGMPTTLTECKITCTTQEKDYYVYYFITKHPGRTLIFCNSIGCVKRLVTILSILNCNIVALHSSLHQRQRLKNLDKFKENDNCILIATDVAARGLDISCIQHVIHYQTPRTTESYVHRSGRTARASNEGITVLLVEPGELQQYLRLCRTLGKTEDLPLFPVQENYLDAVRKRVNLAREIDKLELKMKKSKSSIGWLQKAAEEMDIILDDNLRDDPDECESLSSDKKVGNVKRKQLNALLEKPIFPKNFSGKYPLNFDDPNIVLSQGVTESSAIEVMKNAMESNNIKHTLKSKHLFKPKIRTTSEHLNLKSYLKKKNSNSKPNFKKRVSSKKKKNHKRR
ncbi:hypothetical protein Trydic_g23940 [Trypoxylus dichotomus]